MRRLQVGSGEGCDAPGLGADSRDPSTVGAELRKKIWELLQGRDHKWSGGYAWQQGRGCGCTGKIGVGGRGVGEQGKGGGKCRVATVLIFLSSSRTKPLWRPWLPQEEYMTRRQREQMDTVSFILPARVHFFFPIGGVGVTSLWPQTPLSLVRAEQGALSPRVPAP